VYVFTSCHYATGSQRLPNHCQQHVAGHLWCNSAARL